MTIGIVGAMDEEISLLLEQLVDPKDEMQAGNRYYRGMLHGHEVVICKSGVGKVNAAITTQVLVDRYHIQQLLFTGVAGAVDPRLTIGDLVISTACIQHDMDVTALGYKRGQIPYQDTSIFEADSALVAIAEEVCQRLFTDRYMKGIVLSGDQFIANHDQVLALHNEFKGVCTEMEGAAVAQACMVNQIPFVIIRSISDKADGSAHVNFVEFTEKASAHSYRIVSEMLKQIPCS